MHEYLGSTKCLAEEGNLEGQFMRKLKDEHHDGSSAAQSDLGKENGNKSETGK